MSKDEHPELVSTRDLATRWNVSIRTIQRMADDGKIPVFVRAPGLKGAYMFRAEDVATKPVSEAA